MKFRWKRFFAFLLFVNVFLPMIFSAFTPPGCECYMEIQLWCSIIFTPVVSFPAWLAWRNMKQYNREHEL